MTKNKFETELNSNVLINILKTYDISTEALQAVLRGASKQAEFSEYRKLYGGYKK